MAIIIKLSDGVYTFEFAADFSMAVVEKIKIEIPVIERKYDPATKKWTFVTKRAAETCANICLSNRMNVMYSVHLPSGKIVYIDFRWNNVKIPFRFPQLPGERDDVRAGQANTSKEKLSLKGICEYLEPFRANNPKSIARMCVNDGAKKIWCAMFRETWAGYFDTMNQRPDTNAIAINTSNYYATLEIPELCNDIEVIKTAFRRLSRIYHPDVSELTNATAAFQAINAAYSTLKNPEKKQSYDFDIVYRERNPSLRKPATFIYCKKPNGWSAEKLMTLNAFYFYAIVSADELGCLTVESIKDVAPVLNDKGQHLTAVKDGNSYRNSYTA